jgi:hypothetical protein
MSHWGPIGRIFDMALNDYGRIQTLIPKRGQIDLFFPRRGGGEINIFSIFFLKNIYNYKDIHQKNLKEAVIPRMNMDPP